MTTKDLTTGALGCALSVLFLYLCAVIPTGKLTLGFIAAVIPCILCIECKKLSTSAISGIAAGLISFLMLPKSGLSGIVIILFCGCFSYYPVLKALIEKKKNLKTEWILKIVYFIIISLPAKLICSLLRIEAFSFFISVAALIFYDILLSFVISYYINNISARIHSSRKNN